MTREHVALLITSYLFASVAIAPCVLAYLILDARRASLPTVLRLHKLLVITSIGLPLILFAFAARPASSQSQIEGPRRGTTTASSVASASQRGLPSTDASARPVTLAATAPRAYVPTVYDLVFLFGGWLAWLPAPGFALFLARYWRQSIQLRALVRNAESSSSCDGARVIRSSAAAAPFAAGCIDKIIVIPSFIRTEAAYVITRHELNHFECNHHLWSLLEAMLAHLFWFNPAMHILRRRGRFYRELECDARTIRSMDRFEYARLLIESAEQIGANDRVKAARHGWIVEHGWIAKSELRKRVDYLIGQRESKRRTVFRVGLIVSLALTVAILGAVLHVNDEFLDEQILQSITEHYAQVSRLGTPAELERMPPTVIEALLVQEDPEFYEHHGVTLFGHSTLTQQLARYLMPRPRHHSRPALKMREFKVTRVLESHFTKDQLLEMYLNTAFFGNHTYGIAAAARTYFDKSYTDLSREEAAMLIPFLVAPSVDNLVADPEVATENQQRLLARMDALERRE